MSKYRSLCQSTGHCVKGQVTVSKASQTKICADKDMKSGPEIISVQALAVATDHDGQETDTVCECCSYCCAAPIVSIHSLLVVWSKMFLRT